MRLQVRTPGPGSSAARLAVPTAPWLQALQAVERLSVAPWFRQGAPEPGPGDITQPSGETDRGHARLAPSPRKHSASQRGSIRKRLAELLPLTKEASEGVGVARLELGLCQLMFARVSVWCVCVCVCLCGEARVSLGWGLQRPPPAAPSCVRASWAVPAGQCCPIRVWRMSICVC